MSAETFGTGADGRRVDLVRLEGGALRAAILTRGAILQDLRLNGHRPALTLGAPDLAAYEGPLSSFGAVIGPVANRIAGAAAVIDGETFRFQPDPGSGTLLHSGATGTHLRHWQIAEADAASVTLTQILPDGLGGFPGHRMLTARYAVDGNALTLTLTATTDRPTLMNMAHHGYWNLGDRPDWGGHTLRIAASEVLEADTAILPTGRRLPVAGTGFDFRAPRKITPGLTARLDHNFCLSRARRALTQVLWLDGPDGVSMDLSTTEPGLQIFDGAPIGSGSFPGHSGAPYGAYPGLAIEPQFWPDAPNHPGFPSILLRPGEDWRQETVWRFSRDPSDVARPSAGLSSFGPSGPRT